MNIKKILALVLCMVMCVSMFPVEAFAADDALPEEKEQTEEVQTGEAAEAPRKEAAEEEPGAENVPGESAEEEPDTAEEPAEDTIFAPAEAEESADEPIPVEFKCQPEEAVITVYSKDEKDETGNPLVIEPEEDGSYLLLPGVYLYDVEAEGYQRIEKEEFEVTAEQLQPVCIELQLTELSDEEADKPQALEPEEQTEEEAAPEAEQPLEESDGQAAGDENPEEAPEDPETAELAEETPEEYLAVELTACDIACVPAQDGSGAVDVSVHYALSEEAFTELADPVLAVTWTGAATLLEGSVAPGEEDGGSFEIDTVQKRILWSLASAENTLSFCLETESTCQLYLNALFSYKIEEQEYAVAFPETETIAAHFDAVFSYDYDRCISVTGFAPAGSVILLFLDHNSYGETMVADDGSFSAEITVDDWAPETAHSIQAQCVVGEHSYQKTASFYRKAERPELIGIRYYDYADAADYVDIYAAMQEGKAAAINYTGNDDPFVFILEYNHPELLDHVYVTATISGLKYSLEAQYDESTNTFIAEGYFIEGNKRLPPDSICVEYTPSGSVRTVDHDLDVSTGSVVYEAVSNDFPDAAAELDESSTIDTTVYTVNLHYEGIEEDLVKTAFEYSIKAIDFATGMELFNQYKQDIRYLSYIIPDLDEDRYYMNLDLTDPDAIRILLVDAADGVNSAFEYVVSCYDSTAGRDQYLKWLKVSEKIGTVTTFVDVFGDMYDIDSDTRDLREEVRNATYLTEEEKEAAYIKIDELNSDRMVFTLLTTMIPLIAATGGAGAPVALLGTMLWVMGTVSDQVFEARAASIKEGDLNVDWACNTGEGSMIDTDGLTYSFFYYLDLNKTEKYENGIMIGYDYYYLGYLDVVVSGSGASNPRQFGNYVSEYMWDLRQKNGGIPVSRYTARSVVYSDGVTAIDGPIYCQYRISAGSCKITLAETVTSVYSGFFDENNFTAGSIGTGSLLEFGWSEVPSGMFSSCSRLKEVKFTGAVRSIGENAFSGCENLTSIVLPGSGMSIGKNAFYGCTGIEMLKLPDECDMHETAFNGCSSLKHVALTQVNVIHDGSTSMRSPFSGCSLESVSFEGTRTVSDGLLYSITGIQSIILPDGVTAIGKSAFENCTGLTDVVIPDGVVSIGNRAFEYCTALTGISIPATVTEIGSYAFSGISNWNTAGPIGGGYDYEFGWTEEIPNYAFTSLSSLTSIVLPTGLKKIGNCTFENCKGLTQITIPKGVKEIGGFAFRNCSGINSISLPDSLTTLGTHAFQNCTGLTEITIPANMKAVNSNTFNGCSMLSSVTLPEGLTGIGESAFYGCRLSRVDFPSTLTQIGPNAFYNNWSLKELDFSGSGPRIDNYAFSGVTATAWFPGLDPTWENVIKSDYRGDITWKRKNVGNHCGYNLLWEMNNGDLRITGTGAMWEFDEDDPGWYEPRETVKTVEIGYGATGVGSWAFNGCSNMTSIRLPDTVTYIGEGAFYDCSSLNSITIPNGVTEINARVFRNCSALTELDIPEGVTKIGKGAFYQCSSLKSISLPDRVKILEGDTLSDCYSLTSVKLPADLTSIDYGVFYRCGITSIVIPANVTYIGSRAFYGCNYLEELRFLGSAPSFDGSYIFTWVTATAYYPADDSSWTEEVRQDYDGSITWIAAGSLTQLSLNKHELTLAAATSETLTADTGGAAATLVWSSSKEAVASVDQKGKVTAHKFGTAVITVKTNDGSLSDSCTVEVLFSDVTKSGAYYYTPVYWAANKGITTGYSDGSFGVGRDCQRRELLIFMWRYSGSPTGYGDARTMFNDMGAYNASSAANKAVAWAYKTGIVKGYADGGIHPTDSIVRKDVMIMLYRMAGKPAVSGTLSFSDCKSFNKNSDTYKAILWGSKNGITNGYSSGQYAGQFGVNLNCLREQIVTFLYRYNNKFG